MKVTRPEPTIYGNCDSWSFIVGKTRRAYRHEVTAARPLWVCNWHVVHRFSTIYGWPKGDNMWASCGAPVHRYVPSRIVVYRPFDMPEMTADRA
jgi:hypothetical protein